MVRRLKRTNPIISTIILEIFYIKSKNKSIILKKKQIIHINNSIKCEWNNIYKTILVGVDKNSQI